MTDSEWAAIGHWLVTWALPFGVFGWLCFQLGRASVHSGAWVARILRGGK